MRRRQVAVTVAVAVVLGGCGTRQWESSATRTAGTFEGVCGRRGGKVLRVTPGGLVRSRPTGLGSWAYKPRGEVAGDAVREVGVTRGTAEPGNNRNPGTPWDRRVGAAAGGDPKGVDLGKESRWEWSDWVRSRASRSAGLMVAEAMTEAALGRGYSGRIPASQVVGNGMRAREAHSLIGQVYDPRNLERAWGRVRANRGAGGVDRVSIDRFERERGQYLSTLRQRLADGTYRPRPVRRVEIDKPGSNSRSARSTMPSSIGTEGPGRRRCSC